MKREYQYTDKEIVQRLLSGDSSYEAYFFQEMCKPLLGKIAWTVFDNLVPLDELSNELLIILKANDWEKLRSFQFQSSLFGWLKIVAVHYFNNNKERLYPNYICSNYVQTPTSSLNLDGASEEEIVSLLKLMKIQQYHDILYMVLIEKRKDQQIASLLCLSESVYHRKKKFAFEHLKAMIINEGSHYESQYIRQEPSLPAPSDEPTREHEITITKIDVETLINMMPNDRYRFVIRSLVLEDKDRKVVAKKMGITTENLDNIKSRALKQLAEIARKEIL